MRTCAALFVAAVARPAQADEPAIPFRVEYGESSACTNVEGFSAELLQRTTRVRAANPDERALVIRIDIAPNGAALAGRLSVRELDGSETARDVPGATCNEITTAMALIAAVLVDPNAAAEPLPEPVPEPSGPPVLPPETAVAPALARSRAPKPPPPAKPAERETSARGPSRFTFGGGAAFALEGAIGPEVTPALSLDLELALERSELLSPLLVVSFERAFPSRTETPNGVARLQWTAGRASACPVRFPSSGPWAIRPCALFEYGALAASGEQTERRESTSVPWLALGATARAEYALLGPLLVALDGGFVVPLRHDTFYFDPPTPENVAFTVPSAGMSVRVGVSARF